MSSAGTTIVTQTSAAPGQEEAFAEWQSGTSKIAASFVGFVRQTVIPPSPPTQMDWVILQHFTDRKSAVAWLRSDARLQRVADIQPLLVGHDDVHLVGGDGLAGTPSPVSAVIATRLKPGQEQAYRRWEQRIAAAQAQAPGFQGYRLEPPQTGVQDDWLAIIRFDTGENLQAWLDAPIRQKLLEEAVAFTDEFHIRVARTGFDQWFDVTKAGAAAAPVWKQNMLVLLALYPVVFLFGAFVQTPWLIGRAGLAFPVALFIGNVFSIVSLNYLVPWISRRFRAWLQPAAPVAAWSGVGGTLVVIGLYSIMVVAFCTLF